jgi:hypothetical protein
VASQLLRLTDQDILDFTSSRNTLHYQPILSKLLCMQMSLATRLEAIVDIAAAAAPPRVQSQMLISPLLPPQPNASTEEQLVNASDPAADLPLQPSEAAAAPVALRGGHSEVELAGNDETPRVATKRPRGGQVGARKKHASATRQSTRTAPVLSSPEPVRASARIAVNDAEPVESRARGIGRAETEAGQKSLKKSYNRVFRGKQREYDDEAYVLAAEQEQQVMADVYAQCVGNVLEMIAERKQDVELANQLNSKNVSGLKCAVCAGPLEMPASSQGVCQKPGRGPVTA